MPVHVHVILVCPCVLHRLTGVYALQDILAVCYVVKLTCLEKCSAEGHCTSSTEK
jgi:hypothetical protein